MLNLQITDMREEVKRAAKTQLLQGLTRCGMKMREFAQGKVPKRTGELERSIGYAVRSGRYVRFGR